MADCVEICPLRKTSFTHNFFYTENFCKMARLLHECVRSTDIVLRTKFSSFKHFFCRKYHKNLSTRCNKFFFSFNSVKLWCVSFVYLTSHKQYWFFLFKLLGKIDDRDSIQRLNEKLKVHFSFYMLSKCSRDCRYILYRNEKMLFSES